MATGGAIKAGEAFIELTLKGARGFNDKLRASLRSMGRLAASAAKVGAALTAAFGAATVALVSVSVKEFVRAGDQIEKMAQRTGASAESLSQLGFAAEQSGSNLNAVEKAFRGMARSFLDLEQGLSTSVDSFTALGLTMRDLEDLQPAERFELIADRLSKIEDPTRRAALAMEIFGRSGTELLPLFNQGAAGIANLREQADILGRTVSGEQAAKAAKLADTWNELKTAIKGVGFEIGAAVAPALTRAVGALRNFLLDWEIWLKQLEVAFLKTFFRIAEGFEETINALGPVLNRLLPDLDVASTLIAEGIFKEAFRAQGELDKLIKAGRPSERLKEVQDEAKVIADEVANAIKETASDPTVGLRAIGGFGARAEQFGVNSIGRRQLRTTERLLDVTEQMNKKIQQSDFFSFI